MQLIQNGTQGPATIPAKQAVSGAPGYAYGGPPGTTPATRWDPDMANTMLAEGVAIATATGVALDPANNAQQLAAIRTLAGAWNLYVNAAITLTFAEAGLISVAAASNFSITLPAANSAGGMPFHFHFVRTDSNTADIVTVTTTGGQVLYPTAGTTAALAAGQTLFAYTDGTNWFLPEPNTFAVGQAVVGFDPGGFNQRFIDGNYGAGWRNDGTYLNLLVTASGNQYATWSLVPFQVTLATGAVQFNYAVTVEGALTVVGAATHEASASVGTSLTVGATLTVGGAATLETSASVGTSLTVGTTLGVSGQSTFAGITNTGFVTLIGDNNPIVDAATGWTFNNGNGLASGYAASTGPLRLGTGTAGPLTTFYYGSATVGSVSTNGSSVLYNTTSDKALKILRGPLRDAMSYVRRLRPTWFNWKTDPDGAPMSGFVAQQLGRVWPAAYTPRKSRPGRRDFMPAQVSLPDLVPLLTAALIEQDERIAALEKALARHDRL